MFDVIGLDADDTLWDNERLYIEAKEKFLRFRPGSLGQASRIEGVTTGDLAALSIHLKKYRSGIRT